MVPGVRFEFEVQSDARGRSPSGFKMLQVGRRTFIAQGSELVELMRRRTFLSHLTLVGAASVAGCSGNGGTDTPTPRVVTKTVYRTPDDYTELQNKYAKLQEDFKQLKQNSVPEDQYQDLQRRYERLQEKHTDLQDRSEEAAFPPYVIAEDRQFKIAYKTLDGETAFYQIGSKTLEAQVNLGTYMRELSIREMRYLDLHDLAGRFAGDSKYTRLGEFGLYYQLNPFVIAANFETIARDIYQRYNTDEKRIRELWNFVTQLNTYSKELQETPRLPLETLLLGGGDCEDMTILAASLLSATPADWTNQFVYMDLNNPADPQSINHTVLFTQTDSLQTFIETTSNQTMAPFESVNGFYVDVTGP